MTKTVSRKMLPLADRKENLAVAFSIIGGIPVQNFNLDRYCSDHRSNPEPTCGTIGCSLGWLAMHPYFTAQGLFLENGLVYLQKPDGTEIATGAAAQYLFGRDAHIKYFRQYGGGLWDSALAAKENLPLCGGSPEQHKQLALARLKRGYKRIH